SSSHSRNGPSPAIRIEQLSPLRFTSSAATNNRSQRLTGNREPTPKMQTRSSVAKGGPRNRSKSSPLRTTETRLGTKKLRERRAVSAAKKLFEIWLRGHRELSLPSHKPAAFFSRVKLLRIDPKATTCVPRAAQ